MPYRRATRLGQALCRHECERVGHGADFETTVWFCRKCGKEISIEPPKRNVPEGECVECARELESTRSAALTILSSPFCASGRAKK